MRAGETELSLPCPDAVLRQRPFPRTAQDLLFPLIIVNLAQNG